MCGIGFVSPAPGTGFDTEGVVLALLVTLQARGTDAAGVAWTDQDGGTWYVKDGVPGRRLAASLHATGDLPQAAGAIVHTRYATLGPPAQNENNHPIVRPGVVLAHNGVVSNHDSVFARLRAQRLARVDSEALAAVVEKSPRVEDALEWFGHVRGSAAVTWMRTGQPEVHVARIVGSPLVVGQTVAGDAIGASTMTILESACRIAGVTLDWVETLAEGTYLRFDQGTMTDYRCFAYRENPHYRPPNYPPVLAAV